MMDDFEQSGIELCQGHDKDIKPKRSEDVSRLKHNAVIAVAVVVGCACIVIGVGVPLSLDTKTQSAVSAFNDTARDLSFELSKTIRLLTSEVSLLADAVSLDPNITRTEFEQLASHIVSSHQDGNVFSSVVEDVALALRLNDFSEFGPFEESVTSSYWPLISCTVKNGVTGAAYTETNLPRTPFFAPIKYAHPIADNSRSICRDLVSETVRNATLYQSVLSGSIITSPPIARANSNGILIMKSVVPHLRASMENSFVGVVFAILSIEKVQRPLMLPNINAVLYDVTETKPVVVLSSSSLNLTLNFSSPSEFERSQSNAICCSEFPVGTNRQWRLCSAPTMLTLVTFETIGVILILVFGVLVVCISLIALITWYLIHQRRASEQKDSFLANVSHELRTPLISVVLSSELLLKSEALTEEARLLAEVTQESSTSLLALINDLLDMSRLQAGHELTLVITNGVSVKACLEKSLKLVKMLAIRSNVQLVVTPFEESTLFIDADEGRLVQVLVNLLCNAIKFSYAGSEVSVTVSSKKKQIVAFHIVDHGRGIPQNELSNLFKPFTQLHQQQQQQCSTGLGLSISRHIVQRMGGSLCLTSHGLNCGTTCTVLLPASKSIPLASICEPSSVHRADDTNIKEKKFRVLLVDDTLLNLSLMKRSLAGMGFEVVTADNGLAAIERCMDSGPFDCIFLDLFMPGLSGLDTCSRIRKEKLVSDTVQIVALTAADTQGIIEEAKEAGITFVVSKPVSTGMLKKIVEHSKNV